MASKVARRQVVLPQRYHLKIFKAKIYIIFKRIYVIYYKNNLLHKQYIILMLYYYTHM